MTHLANIEKKRHSPSYYRFHRICRLAECEIEIHTNRKDHYFCKTDHQQEWWKRQRCSGAGSIKELNRQAKEIEDLKETVEQLKASKP